MKQGFCNISFQAPDWYKEKIEEYCNKNLISKSDLIRQAINEYLDKHNKE